MQLIAIVVCLATVAWMLTEGPLLHVVRAMSCFAKISQQEVTEDADLAAVRPNLGTWATRTLIASLFGAALVGATLHPTTLHFGDLPDARRIELYQRYNPHEHGHSQTLAVAGFPWRGVEGNGGGGWTTDAPTSRESHALWFNFACLFIVGLVIALVLPRRWLPAALPISFGLAAIGGYFGMTWCVYYWD